MNNYYVSLHFSPFCLFCLFWFFFPPLLTTFVAIAESMALNVHAPPVKNKASTGTDDIIATSNGERNPGTLCKYHDGSLNKLLGICEPTIWGSSQRAHFSDMEIIWHRKPFGRGNPVNYFT